MTDHVVDRPLDGGTRARPAEWAADTPAAPVQLTRDSAPLELPDRRVFWGWVWQNIRPVVGWALAALGAVALFLGWYGVSGQALTAKQMPYLVSGGLVGIALVIMAGVFLATEDWRRQVGRLEVLERKVDDLLALLTTDVPLDLLSPAAISTTAARRHERTEQFTEDVVALPTGTVYHRPGCALIAGKRAATSVDAATVTDRNLAPCRVCDPPAPVT